MGPWESSQQHAESLARFLIFSSSFICEISQSKATWSRDTYSLCATYPCFVQQCCEGTLYKPVSELTFGSIDSNSKHLFA